MEADRRELEFLRTLGSGGFGAVYLANLHGRDRFVRRVAVKVMREGLDATPDLVARQKDEARLLGLLAHDGIVQVLDLAEVEGRPAVVMEYVEGVDLADLIKNLSPRRVPTRVALEIIAGVAAALDAAYNSNSALTGQPLRVIHRDIKPANMLLTVHGRVKVLDFGVAKADFARDGHTTNGGWGTPRFMSPEQWLGESYSAPVDIYALGVTLFDLVADRPWERPPLSRLTFEGKVGNQLSAQSDVPEEVLGIIEMMTRFEAADRPTAAEVREHCEAAAGIVGGESLAKFARVEVPPLVEAHSRSNANKPLPGTVTLGGVSQTQTGGGGRAEPTHEPSIVPDTYAPNTPSNGRSTGSSKKVPASEPYRAIAGLAAVAILVGASGVIGLGVLGWNLWGGFSPGADVPVEAVAAVPPEPVLPTPPDGENTLPEDDAGAGTPPKDGFVDPTEPPVAVVPPSPTTTSTPPKGKRQPVVKDPPTPVIPTEPPVEKPVEKAAAVAATFPLDIVTGAVGDTVWIDGIWTGTSPIRGRSFSAGAHTVVISKGEAKTEPYSVTLGANGPNKIVYSPAESKWRTAK
ncbi:MAG: serine/threonine-protein kinase [Myxococcota bacterium]